MCCLIVSSQKARNGAVGRAKSNWAGERELPHRLRALGSDGWKSELNFCRIHMPYTNQKYAYKMMDIYISVQINFSLSINCHDGLTKWGRTIKMNVKARMRVRRGPPPKGSEYRSKCLVVALCLQGQSNQLIKMLNAYCLPNGNWLDRQHIDIWIPEAVVVNEDELAQVNGNAPIQFLAPCLYRPYRRSRLRANSTSIAQLALLDACHGIGSQCYPDLCGIEVCQQASAHVCPASHGLESLVEGDPLRQMLAITDDPSGSVEEATDSHEPSGLPSDKQKEDFERMAKDTDELNSQMKKGHGGFCERSELGIRCSGHAHGYAEVRQVCGQALHAEQSRLRV